MGRVPVPDDYAGGSVRVCGTSDYHYPEADVQLDDRDHGRPLTVREDDEGRYVGCGDDIEAEVRAFFGVSAETDADGASDGASADATSAETDETGEGGVESGTCEAVKADGEVCGRDLPCPYHSDEED